jgi:senataxin
VFKCFTNLLSISPTHHIWAFNTSPELPHTLFSDIKRNTAFQAIVLEAHPTSIVDGKRPETLDTSATPLLWIVDYLVSAVDSEKENSTVVRGFSEALAKAINFCFSDMQHESLKVPARAAAAEAGCQVSPCMLLEWVLTDRLSPHSKLA